MTYLDSKEFNPMLNLPSMRVGPYTIRIEFHTKSSIGQVIIKMDEFFPCTQSSMRNLIKICQLGALPEERYLIEILHTLEDLPDRKIITRPATMKQLVRNIKMIENRLEELGADFIAYEEVLYDD